MKQKFASLGRLTIISSVALSIATVSNFLSYHKYWNGTIFAVQTVDFNILSHTLPTKLSIVLNQGNQEEVQRTLNSNYGLFGMVVTDCKTAKSNCPSQKILYSSQPNYRWKQQIEAGSLSKHPYDVLRNPPPVYAEGRFAFIRDRQRQPTGRANSGTVIGRVYYVRNKPPTFIQDYTRWVQNPLTFTGAQPIYTLTVALFVLGGLSTWRTLERVLHQKRVQQELAQQEQQELLKKQEQLLEQSQSLQQQLQEKIQLLPVLLDQREQARAELERYREEQQLRTLQLEETIARYESQLIEQEEQQCNNAQTLKLLQQELVDFQQREVSTLSNIQQREQAIVTLRHTIAKQELEQQEKVRALERLQEELSLTQQSQVEVQGQLRQRELAVANLKYQIATQHQDQQENDKTLKQLQREFVEVQQHYVTVHENLQQSQCAVVDLRHRIEAQEEEKQEKTRLLSALRQDLQNAQWRESEARSQGEKLSQIITALTFERDQALQRFQELEQFHRAAVPNVEELSGALEAARTELEQTKQIQEIALEENTFLSNEIKCLKTEKEQLEQKCDDTQLQIWELEDQVKFYAEYSAESWKEQSKNVAAECVNSNFQAVPEPVDLSELSLVLVGGHQAVRREVICELTKNYKLQNYVEIPPSSEAYISRSSVRARISNCDLIFIITEFIGHDLYYIISDLQNDGALTGQVMPLNCKGKSGIVRGIVTYVKQNFTPNKVTQPNEVRSRAIR